MTPIQEIAQIDRALRLARLKGYSGAYDGSYLIQAAVPGTASTVEVSRYDSAEAAVEAINCMRGRPWQILQGQHA